MNIILLKHFNFDDPMVFDDWARAEGHKLTILNPAQGRLDHELLSRTDLLIVGGSPASVYEERLHPWLASEKSFVGEAIKQRIKVLGICFGAQMIAEILGGRAYAHSVKEIGWHEIRRNDYVHPALMDLPQVFHSLQWHGDTFSLPPGAVNLASSKYCENQIFAWGDHVLALQFHLETSAQCIDIMLDVWKNDLLREEESVQKAEVIRGKQFQTAESFRWLRGILNHFIDVEISARSF
ncbi:type 1 glutamine amidotransferase [Saccharibacillus sp. JS10]|uniref:type 1 glutamine amidotransferase n=1 Tax=Saccharibacillus sp. JS10 TaxID=2950552 RepID=UPI00210D8813|nr:type 1 glutamine amidotransferase [Saccharibacillus sp. JS10]MCQ4088492.1 type 1 glutamine amidotransferase [Saccharibacillus sp. JS10]